MILDPLVYEYGLIYTEDLVELEMYGISMFICSSKNAYILCSFLAVTVCYIILPKDSMERSILYVISFFCFFG